MSDPAATAFEAVIGLETHIQLNTRSKIFCACPADSWGASPNTNICPVCCGLPGVLPALNRAAVDKAIRLAAAMQAESIQETSYFARKNYFYPDLPKGYQISQYDEPLARGGRMELPLSGGGTRTVRIAKLHLEEDAGKTVNEGGRRLIDFNRCGVPLVEMVTEPDLRSPEEAARYLERLRQLLRWIGVSEADMERGQLRCDANVSIRRRGETGLNPKTEIKNVNSIDSLRAAITAEVERQARLVVAGGRVEAWTLDWDEARGLLSKMRSKETEADYRYFREPDLLPLVVARDWRSGVVESLPELPLERRRRLTGQYGLPEYDAEILTEDRSLADYFEAAVAAHAGQAKAISNWMMNDVLRLIRSLGIRADELRLPPAGLAEIVAMVESGKITGSTAKDLLLRAHESGIAPDRIVREQALGRVSDDAALRELAEQVVRENPQQVEIYRKGKATVLGWFVGQVMRRSGGKADPARTRALLEELLG